MCTTLGHSSATEVTGLLRPRVGVSACLLGERVRHDGGHKRSEILADECAGLVEWVKVCPEVEMGVGTPRDPIHLVKIDSRTRLITVNTGLDLTSQMEAYARRRFDALNQLRLSGFVFKSKSPSCGLTGVAVSDGNGLIQQEGVGLFAAALQRRWPELPVEEDIRLADEAIRRRFFADVHVYHRRRQS